ncbi:ABC-2 type transport system ATP-binding protein [Labedella gwakjiensis]|uniref:ABC transporter ATP-binding protein n=1 Tax=Labedella gwakjiensis TaxID=390269 RepID=A0A2P8GXU8_9MICO|nr:ABC transporter ATP-binding protein [Labedella gwakjiensis]PSL38787.1 ABC-2 type transport system ATP-binding protein [Labedella gwakjiensis]RUQ86736.1 ABC transporter ATP-binding protein [Labedella gwakjiensis]
MTDTPVIVSIDDVSKRFVVRKDNSLKERLVTFGRGRQHREDFWALRDVSVDFHAGTTVGLIGHNGSGKSTLLKVIGGIIDATTGSVSTRGRLAALLELGAGFHPDLTGRENVFLNAAILGLSREETEARFDDIHEFSGIGDFIDTQVKFYSSGMYVRLAFAVAVHTDPDLLLVDEVLAVGDEAFQRKCLDKIRSFQQEGRTIILVTHNLGQVTELCDRAVLLHHGRVLFDGDPREAVAEFRDKLEERRVEETHHGDTDVTIDDLYDGRVLSVDAYAEGREVGVDVEQGDRLVIDTTLTSRDGVEDWICAIQIDNEMGQVVYGTTSKRVGERFSPLTGERTVRLVLDDVRFGTGKYFINASLMDMAGRHLHDFPQATSFNVAYTPLAVGVTYAEPSFADLGSPL